METETDTPLARWRRDQRYTPLQAAEHLGVSLPTWSRWENDKRRIPAERVPTIADKTGIAWHDLRPDVFPSPEASAA